MSYLSRLKNSKSFDDVFELVKRSVYETLRLRRAGLTLILGELPTIIGAYHIVGSNVIVINKILLEEVKRIARSKEELNSYLFSILAHEYLHSLGIMDEGKVKLLTYELCKTIFGKEHPATQISKKGIIKYYPQLLQLVNYKVRRFGNFEVVKEFDSSNMPYIK
jgi:hypothetical protein